MRFAAYAALAVALSTLCGCGISTPPCADDKTVGLIKKIFRNSLDESVPKGNEGLAYPQHAVCLTLRDELASIGQSSTAAACRYLTEASHPGGQALAEQTAKSLSPHGQAMADQIANAIQINVTTIRTSSNDEKIKKLTCSAVLEVSLPTRAEKILNLSGFRSLMAAGYRPTWPRVAVAGNVIKHDIEYTTQVTDDTKKQLVELRGHIPIVEIAIHLGSVGAFMANEAGLADSKASATVAKPEAISPPATTLAEAQVPIATPNPVQPQALPPLKWAPSFDCAKASSLTEKAVCSTPLLGKLDGAMSESYKDMLASDIGDGARNDLKASQRRWLAERNNCATVQCLTAAYRKRIDEVCAYPVLSGAHPICVSSEDIK